MKADYINPFLSSSITVIESLMQQKPSVGKLQVTHFEYKEDDICLKIKTFGQFESELIFGFSKDVAIRMVSCMMGGAKIEQFDEICLSAVAELGNMISGNASTLLYNDGVMIDISPPEFVEMQNGMASAMKALDIPLYAESIGEFHIHIMS